MTGEVVDRRGRSPEQLEAMRTTSSGSASRQSRTERNGRMITLGLASESDLPALKELIPLSARSLSRGWYTPEQIESAVRYVFGPDSQLIADRTYFVAVAGERIVGCGGWSHRSTLYGGDQMKAAADPPLDPARDAARIRAFFVHPAFARRGIGSAILGACMGAALEAGFRRVELMATLPGVPLYRRFGFEELEAVTDTLPDGVALPFIRMARPLTPAAGERGSGLVGFGRAERPGAPDASPPGDAWPSAAPHQDRMEL